MKRGFYRTGFGAAFAGAFLAALLAAFLTGGCELDPEDKTPDGPDSLAGTVWVWEAWGSVIEIAFLTDTEAHVTNDGEESDHNYRYSAETGKGVIAGLNRDRKFAIKGTTLTYPTWGDWGHSFDFFKRDAL